MEKLAKFGDFLQRVQAYLWALGLALVGIAFFIARTNLPPESLALVAVGLVLVLLPFGFLVAAIIRYWINRLDPPETALPDLVPSPPSSMKFSPYVHMSSTIMFIDLSGLWGKTERYIDVTVYASSTAGDRVKLTGVEGRMMLGAEECSLPPRLLNGPREWSELGRQYSCIIRQPLMPEMAQEVLMGTSEMNLYSDAGRVRLTLAGMKWVGTVRIADSDNSIERVVSDETVLIRGPVREGDADKVLRRMEPAFLSQVYYHLHDGSSRT